MYSLLQRFISNCFIDQAIFMQLICFTVGRKYHHQDCSRPFWNRRTGFGITRSGIEPHRPHGDTSTEQSFTILSAALCALLWRIIIFLWHPPQEPPGSKAAPVRNFPCHIGLSATVCRTTDNRTDKRSKGTVSYAIKWQ